VSLKYSEMVYYGLWFSPLREALDAFMAKLQNLVNGDVRLKLFRGQCVPVGRKSANSLYDLSLATYGAEDAFDHRAGEYFCQIWGLPMKVCARAQKKNHTEKQSEKESKEQVVRKIKILKKDKS
jgi:argininosuccinate synthase